MGVDLVGERPDHEIGRAFHINWAGWNPLWTYTTELCSDIITRERYDNGFYNRGSEFTSEEAWIIGNQLMKGIQSGSAEEYDRRWKETHDPECVCLGSTPSDLVLCTDDSCPICKGSGKRYAYKDADEFIKTVRQFADFCLHCGGFRIW